MVKFEGSDKRKFKRKREHADIQRDILIHEQSFHRNKSHNNVEGHPEQENDCKDLTRPQQLNFIMERLYHY